ncbi:hypothetical protein HK414_17475 [Ramlibacter terrae]|uniref:Uncharacterized protein n=1 Tax=Ramlibacter terrae TaxID=2732511 RepID=A0ABX6NZG3_9BURK|nr:hypothetical protein HK414_17475 [Ramlibacter terrae]
MVALRKPRSGLYEVDQGVHAGLLVRVQFGLHFGARLARGEARFRHGIRGFGEGAARESGGEDGGGEDETGLHGISFVRVSGFRPVAPVGCAGRACNVGSAH